MAARRAPIISRRSFTLDLQSITVLESVAAEFEGNGSMAVRQVLREAAERRGLVVDRGSVREEEQIESFSISKENDR